MRIGRIVMHRRGIRSGISICLEEKTKKKNNAWKIIRSRAQPKRMHTSDRISEPKSCRPQGASCRIFVFLVSSCRFYRTRARSIVNKCGEQKSQSQEELIKICLLVILSIPKHLNISACHTRGQNDIGSLRHPRR